MTLDEYLAEKKSQFPNLAARGRDSFARFLSKSPDFDPSWASEIQPAPAPVAPTPSAPEVQPASDAPASDRGDISRGFEVSARQIPQMGYGLVGLVGATAENFLGGGGVSTKVKDWGLRGYEESNKKIAPVQKDTDSLSTAWSKAKEGDVGALVDWAQYGLGYGAGQAAESLAMSAMGAAAGAAVAPEAAPVTAAGGAIAGLVAKSGFKQAAFTLVEKMIAKEALKIAEEQAVKTGAKDVAELAASAAVRKEAASALGRNLAIASNSIVQEAGSIYGDAVDQARKDGRELNGADLARIWGAAVVAGKVDAFGDKLGLDALAGKGLAKGLAGVAAHAAVGAGTEAVQTAVERIGSGQSLTDEDAIRDYVDSAGIGAIGGAGSAVPGVISPHSADVTTTPPGATKPVIPGDVRYGFGDITPPTVENPVHTAVLTVDGKEMSFIGRTADEASANREAFVNEQKAAQPVAPAGPVTVSGELPPGIKASLSAAGVPAAQINTLSANQALEIIGAANEAASRVEGAAMQRATRTANIRALTVQALSRAVLTSEAETALGQPALPGLETAVTTTGAPVIGPTGAPALPPTANASNTDGIATLDTTPEAQAAALDTKVKAIQAIAMSAPQAKKTANAVARVDVPAATEMKTAPLTGGESANPAAPVATGALNVAEAPAPVVQPAEGVQTPAPVVQPAAPAAVATPSVALPVQAAPVSVAGQVTEFAPKVAGVSKENSQRGVTRFAAVFRKTDGTEVAVPVYLTAKGETRVLLDPRTTNEARQEVASKKIKGLGQSSLGKLSATSEELRNILRDNAAYPVHNDANLINYGTSIGGEFTGRVIKYASAIAPGIYTAPTVDEATSVEKLGRKAVSQTVLFPQITGSVIGEPSPVGTLASGIGQKTVDLMSQQLVGVKDDVLAKGLSDVRAAVAKLPAGERANAEIVGLARVALDVIKTTPGLPEGILSRLNSKDAAGERQALATAYTLVSPLIPSIPVQTSPIVVKTGGTIEPGPAPIADPFAGIPIDRFKSLVLSWQQKRASVVPDPTGKLEMIVGRLKDPADHMNDFRQAVKLDAFTKMAPDMQRQVARFVSDTLVEELTAADYAPVMYAEKVRGMSSFKATERPATLAEQAESESYKPKTTPEDVTALLRELSARGLNVLDADVGNNVLGRYTPGFVLLGSSWSTSPSVQRYTAALHEAAHDVFSKLPDSAKLAMQRGVEQLARRLSGRTDIDARLGAATYADYAKTAPGPRLSPQQWGEEVVVESAALGGMDRDVSRSLWSLLVRRVKSGLLQMNMFFQEQFLGTENVSPETVQSWVDNQIDGIMAGDSTRFASLIERYSGLRPTLGRFAAVQHDQHGAWLATYVDPINGQVKHTSPLGLDAATVEASMMLSVQSVKEQAIRSGAWDRNENLAELSKDIPPEILSTERQDNVRQQVASAAFTVARQDGLSKIAAANELDKPFQAVLQAVAAQIPQISEASRAWAKAHDDFVPSAVTDPEELSKIIGVTLPSKIVSTAQGAYANIARTELGIENLPVGALPAETSIADLKDPDTKARADLEIFSQASRSASTVTRKLNETRVKVIDLEAKLNRAALNGQKFAKSPADWKAQDKALAEDIRSQFAQIIASKDLFADADSRLSRVGEHLRMLNTDADFAERMSNLEDNFFDKVNFDDGWSLNSIMKSLYQMEQTAGIELATARPADIRDAVIDAVNNDPKHPLARMVNQKGDGAIRGTAVLSALISYVKGNALANELMRANLVNVESQRAALVEYQRVMSESTDAQLEELARLYKTGEKMTNKYIQAALNARDEYQRIKRELAVADRDLAVMKTADGVFAQVLARAQANIGNSGNYVHGPNSKFAHATSAAATVDQIFETSSLKTVSTQTDSQLRQVIADNEEWLSINRGNPRTAGYLYNTLNRQNFEMKKALTGDATRGVMSGLFNARIRGFADSLAGNGTAGGLRLSRRINREVSLTSEWKTRDEVESAKWEDASDRFLKATGLDFNQYIALFYNPAGQTLQVIPEDMDAAMDRMNSMFANSESTAQYWAKPGAQKQFRRMIEALVANTKWETEKQDASGANLVEDPNLSQIDPYTKKKTTMYRKQVARGALTWPMFTARALASWTTSVPVTFSTDDAEGNIFAEAERYGTLKSNAGEVRSQMNKFLGLGGWDQFMAPLLGNPLGGVPAPTGLDGVQLDLNTRDAAHWVESSRGDFFAFVDAAYAASETDQSLEDYTVTMLRFVGAKWKQLDSNTNVRSQGNALLTMPGVPRIGIDARVSPTWPPQWKEPRQFGKQDVGRASRGIAAVGALGRNLEYVATDLAAMNDEIQKHMGEILAKYPAASKDEQVEIMKKAKGGPISNGTLGFGESDYDTYKALEGYAKENTKIDIEQMLNTEDAFLFSNKFGWELWGKFLTGLTSGFRSALKNPASLLNQFALEGELSAASVRDTLGGYGVLGKVITASLGQSVGLRPFNDDPFVKALYEQGIYDSATSKTIGDTIKGDRGVQGQLGKYTTFLRRAGAVFTDTRLGMSQGAKLPALRLFNQFGYTQTAVNAASNWNNARIYHEIATHMADYARANGPLTEMPTAKQIGLRGSDVRLAKLDDAFAMAGGDLLTIANEMANNRSNNIHPELLRYVNRITSDRVSSESSLAGNNKMFTKSKGGKVAGTFVGWGFRQTASMMKPFIDTDQKVTTASAARGVAILALGMLPATIAYSMLLDRWDDETDRKRDKVQFKDARNPRELWQATLEAATDVGSFGFGWDLFSTAINPFQGTAGRGALVSVDQRVVAISSLQALAKALNNAANYGIENITMSSSGTELATALGAGGSIQNLEILNRATGNSLESLPMVGGMFETLRAKQDRASTNNYIREIGRRMGLPVLEFGSGGLMGTAPKPYKPWVVEMQLASLDDNREAFQRAYSRALKAALPEFGSPKLAQEKVVSAYQAQHPLKANFKGGTPTVAEVRELISLIPDRARPAVLSAIDNFNRYGASIGARPFLGSTEINPQQAERMGARKAGVSVEEFRRQRAAF